MEANSNCSMKNNYYTENGSARSGELESSTYVGRKIPLEILNCDSILREIVCFNFEHSVMRCTLWMSNVRGKKWHDQSRSY